jgi:CBS domain containing-hemolysin-like protein
MLALGRVRRSAMCSSAARYPFEIVDMDGNRVDRVLVRLLKGR